MYITYNIYTYIYIHTSSGTRQAFYYWPTAGQRCSSVDLQVVLLHCTLNMTDDVAVVRKLAGKTMYMCIRNVWDTEIHSHIFTFGLLVVLVVISIHNIHLHLTNFYCFIPEPIKGTCLWHWNKAIRWKRDSVLSQCHY